MEIEDGLLVSFDFLRVRLAMKHAIPAAVTFCGLHLKLAGRESEQVSRDRLSLRITDADTIPRCFVESLCAVRHGLPASRHVQLERIASLQVGLVKAGKGKMRAGRDEQRVHEIGIPIQ